MITDVDITMMPNMSLTYRCVEIQKRSSRALHAKRHLSFYDSRAVQQMNTVTVWTYDDLYILYLVQELFILASVWFPSGVANSKYGCGESGSA